MPARDQGRVAELETELAETREALDCAIRSLETSNEAQKAINEAAQSVSAELTALNRQLQEDLSVMPEGIVDFGVADMGDAKQGRRTPIDLVMEWLPTAKPKDALHWLAQRIGVQLSEPPKRQKANRANGSAPGGGDAHAGGSGGDGGGDHHGARGGVDAAG